MNGCSGNSSFLDREDFAPLRPSHRDDGVLLPAGQARHRILDPVTDDRDDDQAALEQVATQVKAFGDAVGEETVVEWARSAGVQLTSDGALRTRLPRACPSIRWSRPNFQYVWRDPKSRPDTIEPVKPLDALVRWGRTKDESERSAIEADLRQRLSEADVDETTRRLGQAVGLLEAPVDWSTVPADDSVPVSLMERLAARAPAVWLVKAAAYHSNTAVRTAINELDDTTRCEAATVWVDRFIYPSSIQPGIAQQLGRVHKLLQPDPTPRYVNALVRLAVRATQWADPDPQDRGRVLGAVAKAVAVLEPGVVKAALDTEFAGTDDVAHWLSNLGTSSPPFAVRSYLIKTVAMSSHSRAIHEPASWAGLDLTQIGETLTSEEVRPLLDQGLSAPMTSIVAAAAPPRFGVILGAIAAYPVLEPFAPISLLARLIGNDEPSARVARAAVDPIVVDAVREAQRLADEAKSQLRTEIDRLRVQTLEAQRNATEARDAATATENRLRDAHRSSASSSDAERRQARVDVLRAWVDETETIRSIAATLPDSSLLDDRLAEMTRKMSTFDVSVVGSPGDRVRFDPSSHESVDAVAGDIVELLTPVYRFEGTVTPLRYGLVRKHSGVDGAGT